MSGSPIPMARYAAAPGGQMVFIQPDSRYASRPPSLFKYRCDFAPMRETFQAALARPGVPCPPEAVMVYQDAFVLDGKQVITRDGTGIAESFHDVGREPWRRDYQLQQLAWIAGGEVVAIPASGAPVVAIFEQYSDNFGHVVADAMPRLLHLAAMGLSEVRLLLPEEAVPHQAALEFASRALGLRAEFVVCPERTVARVAALHWVSPPSLYPHRLSPSLMRLMARLVAAAPATPGPSRLFVARPDNARRRMTNAAEVQSRAAAAGLAVVEPSRLDFPSQLALFAGARVVAGPLGAGLTLTAAMPQGGRVAMFDPGIADPFFWNIACLGGLDFDWAFTAPVVPGNEAAFRDDMTVPPALLDTILGRLAATG